MLRLSTEQYDWVLVLQRERLARAQGALLATQWPALAAKLGDRATAFVEAALAQAQRYGLHEPAHAARYANLWCVWGPAFDDKPGFEWVPEILADDRRTPAVKVQQVVLRSRDELLKRAGAGVTAEQFDAADAAAEALAGQAVAAPWIDGPPGVPQPRQVCDMTAFDLALGDQSWRQEYRLALSGQAVIVNRAPVAAEPQRYRTDTPPLPGTPVEPRQVAALASQASKGHKAWLHVRCAVDAVCDAAVHPRLELKSDAGGQVFQGQPARLVKVPLHVPEEFVPPRPVAVAGAPAASAAALAKPGAPVAVITPDGGLCRERAPRYLAISACTCGLRRAGAPLGRQEAVLSIFPADQWLIDLKPLPQPAWQWPLQGGREPAPPPLVRLEREGQALPGDAWQLGWRRLAEAFVNGMDGWLAAIGKQEALLQPHLDVTPNLMHGVTAWTWGAREACTPEGSSGFTRAQGITRLVACDTDLALTGEIRAGGGHARVRLRSQGQALLHHELLRDQPEPALAALLSGVKVEWRHPFELEVDALSHPDLIALCEAPGSLPGALAGEAGLRPRPDGQGWMWYLQLRVEPAVLSLSAWDPVRGHQQFLQPLWPAQTLVDWSVG